MLLQGSNNIGADGAGSIADAMRNNSTVKELYLVRNFSVLFLLCFIF